MLASCQKNRWFNIQQGADKQLLKLYNHAAYRISNDLNVVRLIKNLRDLRILVNAEMMNRKTKFFIDHSKKNVINLEDSVESDDSDCFDDDSQDSTQRVK